MFSKYQNKFSFCRISLLLFSLLFLIYYFSPSSTLANSWYYTNNMHPTRNARNFQSSFSGSNNTYTYIGNFTGERQITNGTSTNDWTTQSYGSNVTMPAGNWTFSITGNTTSREWYPRIKIWDSNDNLIFTSTSPTRINTTSYMTVSWTEYIPSFNLGPGGYYSADLYTYHTRNSNRTDRFRVNSGDANFITDTYSPASYTPKSRSWNFYDDHTPATPIISYASENSTPANMYNKNNIRLRLTIAEIGGSSQTGRKKLQFSADGISFSDVGNIGSGAVWAYCDGGGTDDSLVPSLLVSTSSTAGPYVESGTASSTFNHAANSAAEFDYCLTENFAYTNSTYYFRALDIATGQIIYPDSGYVNPAINISNHNKVLEIGSSFNLTAINMDDAPGPTTGSFTNMYIRDLTGALAGWSSTATATNFSDGSGHTITIDNLTMTAATITPQLAESTTGITLGSGPLSPTTPLNLATASTNNGAGNFTIDGTFSLYVPVATVPGAYTTTITLTIS